MKVVASIGPISIGAVVTDNWRYTIRESFMMTYAVVVKKKYYIVDFLLLAFFINLYSQQKKFNCCYDSTPSLYDEDFILFEI